MPYVSRGGLKLEGALEHFEIDVTGMVALDVGASTGGFTDCLLQRGALKVFAIDVGYNQLAWSLRQDPRVVSMERLNVRHLEPETLGEPVDVVIVGSGFDYDAEARIGGISLVGQERAGSTTLTGRSPSALPVGVHDVEIVRGDGVSEVMPAAFEVSDGCACSARSSWGGAGLGLWMVLGVLLRARSRG